MVTGLIRSPFSFLLPTIFLLLTFCSCSGNTGVDLVLRGGKVHTLDPALPWAEALAIEGDRLVAVGSSTDMDRHIGRDTVVVELEGRPVLPGFHDAHVHLMKGAVQLDWALMTEVDSREDILLIVKAFAEAHPDRPWVLGAGVRGTDPSIVLRTDLDRIVPNRPVYLEAHDCRFAWVNSKALELAGMDLGVDAATATLVRNTLPRPSHEEQLEILKRGVAHLHRFGVTSIETDASFEEVELIEELERLGDLKLRIRVVPTVTSVTDVERLAIEDAVRIPIDSSTASIARHFEQRGLQVIFDADGDDAVEVALAFLGTADPTRRHRLEGWEVVSRDDVTRLAELGVMVTVPPLATSPDLHLRADRLAWKSLLASGGQLVFGSRWPEHDLDPLFGIYAAVTRQDLHGKPEEGWMPEERLSVEQAVRAYTLNGVSAAFGDKTRGSLKAGKLADIVVLTEDIFKIVPRRIVEVEAAMTLVGGRVVYLSPSFLPEEMRLLLTQDYN